MGLKASWQMLAWQANTSGLSDVVVRGVFYLVKLVIPRSLEKDDNMMFMFGYLFSRSRHENVECHRSPSQLTDMKQNGSGQSANRNACCWKGALSPRVLFVRFNKAQSQVFYSSIPSLCQLQNGLLAFIFKCHAPICSSARSRLPDYQTRWT